MPFRVLQLVTAPIRLSGRLLQFSLTVAATPFRMLAPGKHRKDLVKQAGPPVAAISSAQHEAHPGMYSAADVQAMLGMVKEALRAKTQALRESQDRIAELAAATTSLTEQLDNMSYLFTQEQQHRLQLQDELNSCAPAASDLCQLLTQALEVDMASSPGSSPLAAHLPQVHRHGPTYSRAPSLTERLGSLSSPLSRYSRAPSLTERLGSLGSPVYRSEFSRRASLDFGAGSADPTAGAGQGRLASGLPGVLDRQESRLQLELAVIQRRLARVAQLQDCPQPRTPRVNKPSPLHGFEGTSKSGVNSPMGPGQSIFSRAGTKQQLIPGESTQHSSVAVASSRQGSAEMQLHQPCADRTPSGSDTDSHK